MNHYYCPRCWGEIQEEEAACHKCRRRPSENEKEAFPFKLMHGLTHPQRPTVLRAIRILGDLKFKDAVGSLPALFDRPGVDLHMRRGIIVTLGKIQAEKAVETALAGPATPRRDDPARHPGGFDALAGEKINEALLKAVNDPVPKVRQKAKEVLDERMSILPHRLG